MNGWYTRFVDIMQMRIPTPFRYASSLFFELLLCAKYDTRPPKNNGWNTLKFKKPLVSLL